MRNEITVRNALAFLRNFCGHYAMKSPQPSMPTYSNKLEETPHVKAAGINSKHMALDDGVQSIPELDKRLVYLYIVP